MALELIAGAALGLTNLISNASANSERAEALARYRKKLIDTQYDPVEKAKAIDLVGDAYNTQIADSMNTLAPSLGRYLNSGTAKAVSTSKMLGQRAGAMVDESRRIDDFNKKIDIALAESELNEPIDDPLGDLISGTATGVQLGMSIGNYFDELDTSEKLRGLIDRLDIGKSGNAGVGKYRKRQYAGDITKEPIPYIF